ncbi:nuclear transport factor 2 family protein [Wenzhouxiangella sp. EGI_FJ10305]|uniref:nuclear transport factor 2 family protein n=1 Tax=Wenzhouxiangella sp. EGI_FJ10305 TaxID=3243768 RepID=UPI0035D5DE6F
MSDPQSPTFLRLFGLAFLIFVAAPSVAEEPTDLHATIAELDTAMFEAFNSCEDPSELARHEAFFAEDVEFYHDQGGVTFSRDEMIANTRNNACGNYWRERIEGTLDVHPVANFGAIAIGEHRFCEFATGDCPGVADFTTVWRKGDDGWRVTRVLSYGHRPSE